MRGDRAVFADAAVVADLTEVVDLRSRCRSTSRRFARDRCTCSRRSRRRRRARRSRSAGSCCSVPSRNAQPKPSLPTIACACEHDAVAERCSDRRRTRAGAACSRAPTRAPAPMIDAGREHRFGTDRRRPHRPTTCAPTYTSGAERGGRIDDGAGMAERPARARRLEHRQAASPAPAAARRPRRSACAYVCAGVDELRVGQDRAPRARPARRAGSGRRSRTSARVASTSSIAAMPVRRARSHHRSPGRRSARAISASVPRSAFTETASPSRRSGGPSRRRA